MRYIGIMDKTISLLERLGSLLQQQLREDANELGLQTVHLQILSYLQRANRYSDIPIAVAEYLGLTRGTVSQSIKLLQQKGLLIQRNQLAARRKVHLQLTEQGKAVLQASWLHSLQAELAEDTSAAARLEMTLESLLGKLQRARGNAAFGVCRGCVFHQREQTGARCGLTGECLSEQETVQLCREWQSP